MRAKMMKDEETYTEYTATIPESCAAAFLKLQPNMDFLEPISKTALKAKSSEFRCEAIAAGTIRTESTMSPEKMAE